MAGDELKKVTSGQRLRIPAQTYNTFIDVARAYKDNQHSQKAKVAGNVLPAGQILVRNDTDTDQEQYAVLGIDGPIISPEDNAVEFKRQVAIKGVVPVEGVHEGRFVIIAGPLKPGSLGSAWISGVCPANVELADADDRYVDIQDGVTGQLLSNAHGGAELLWRSSGSGAQLSIIRLDWVGQPTFRIYRRSSDHENHYTYNATRYKWDRPTVTYVSTSETAVCLNVAEYGLPSIDYHYLKSTEFMMQIGPAANNGIIPVFACTTIGRWQ